jgi:CRP-like cAMP-binding protein
VKEFSMVPVTKGTATQSHNNHLLRYLDPAALARLGPKLKLVTLAAEEVLFHPEDRISHIYFPTTAILCMLTIMDDGRTVGSATVGHEGASWLSATLGTSPIPCQTMVAVAGDAYKIAAEYVEEEIRQNRIFHNLVSEYSRRLLISSLRIGACNALHTLTQRTARWLLITCDRTSGKPFAITHEFLSAILASSRTSLTAVLGDLETSGGIHTRRGRIEFVDQASLERSSCECYRILHDNFQQLHSRAKALHSSCPAAPNRPLPSERSETSLS